MKRWTKRKKINTPKYKKYNRAHRLKVANKWIKSYEGKNVVEGYSKHFAVDKLCVIAKLGILGYAFSEKEQMKKNLQ
ncbi:hypothetical protein RZN22_12915 [Bacillaceae bacterium S4-13-58]